MIAAFLALVTLGVQCVCGCPELGARRAAEARRAIPPCAKRAECCHRRGAALESSVPAKSDPCERCNLVHRTDQIAPDQGVAASVNSHLLAPSFEAPLVAEPLVLQPAFTTAARNADVPIPPLLRDLFHAQTLLLI
jgi:hypothetical protein